MSNLNDLSGHLFDQLQRLNTAALKGDDLKDEIERSKAISGIAKDITNNARLMLDAATLAIEYPNAVGKMPAMLTNDGKKK